MTPLPRRAAVYLRVSLDATGEGLAVDRQREACLAIVESRGWSIVEEYVDNSISATDAKKNRPGYDHLLRDLKAGRFDALVCYDLDRLTRQPRQLEDWIDAADSGALALVTANGEADLTTDAGRLFARIKLAVARSEVERKSVRQRDAARQRSELGRPPLGVRLTGYTSQGDLVPDEAAVVLDIFQRFADGATLRGIARHLTDRGVTTRHGKPWNPSSIRTILTNPRYAGRAVYQGQETGKRGTWTPIVTDDMYDTVQALLTDERRRTQVSTARKHLGSGLYLCGVCDEPVSAWSGLRYRCRDGGHVNRSQGPVDRYVELLLTGGDVRDLDASQEGHVIGRLAQGDVAGLLVGSVDPAPHLAELEKQRRRLRRAEEDYREELIDGRLYKSSRTDALAAIRAAETTLANITATAPAAGILAAPDPCEAFRSADLTARRSVIDTLMTVRLHPGHRYSRRFDPSTISITWKA